MRPTHRDAENRYTLIREAAMEVANTHFNEISGLRLQLITTEALNSSKKWRENRNRQVDWDWKEGYRTFSFRYPKRFELAIWHNDELITLALGRPTFRNGSLRLDFMEASPEERSVRAYPLVIFALTMYAFAIGVDEIRLVQPINDAVKKYYEKAGLTYVAKGDFLFKKIFR